MNSCYNVDEPPKTLSKKSQAQNVILFYVSFMKYLGQKNLQIQKEDGWLRESGEGNNEKSLMSKARFAIVYRNIFKLDMDGGSTTLRIY